MPGEPEDTDSTAEEAQGGSLVPLYGTSSIMRGIQAYRRGDLILYTIRGEPRDVLELMGQLDKQGVGEVVALIRHQAPEPDEAEDEDAEAEPTA